MESNETKPVRFTSVLHGNPVKEGTYLCVYYYPENDWVTYEVLYYRPEEKRVITDQDSGQKETILPKGWHNPLLDIEDDNLMDYDLGLAAWMPLPEPAGRETITKLLSTDFGYTV